MATSPGQSAYRAFSKEVTAMKRLIETALKSGELYTYDEVNDFFEPLLDNFEEVLTEEELNQDLWRDRANTLILDRVNQIASKYELPEETHNDNPDSEEEKDIQGDTILGYPVISTADCRSSSGSVRGQVLLTLEELSEYLEPIPASVIRGIVLVYDDSGKVVGFSLCGLKNTD